MKKIVYYPVFLFLLLAFPALAADVPAIPEPPPAPQQADRSGISILSIIPGQGEPGTVVTISGNGFTAGTMVLLAAAEIPATIVGPRQLSFEIPNIAPGLYALSVRRADGVTSHAYGFSVVARKPVALELTPDTVYACAAGNEREVTISGRNFRPGAQVLFNGSAIRSRLVSPETLIFITPSVEGGLHQVQVKNVDGTVTGILGLMIDAKPEITSVVSGEEFVSAYNLIVEGRNFQQGSTVVVMEEQSLELTGQQQSMDVKRLQSGGNAAGARDQVVYVNCNRIIYQRHPYSMVTKNLKVQVINPNGSESALVSVNAP